MDDRQLRESYRALLAESDQVQLPVRVAASGPGRRGWNKPRPAFVVSLVMSSLLGVTALGVALSVGRPTPGVLEGTPPDDPLPNPLFRSDGDSRSGAIRHYGSDGRLIGSDEDQPPSQFRGFLSVNTVPWTNVSVDGAPIGSTPVFKKSLPLGVHTVELVNEYESIRKSVRINIVRGENLQLRLNLK